MPPRVERERQALIWVAITLVLGAGLIFWPFAPWVILALWMAGFARRIHRPLSRFLGGRPRLGAALTLVILLMLLVPAVILLTVLVGEAIDLIQGMLSSDRFQEILQRLVSGGGESKRSSDLIGLAMSQGGRAWAIAQQVAGTAARVVIGLVILIAGAYALLIDGARWYSWTERHVPISATAFRRFADAFVETGRGLFVGIIGAGLAQSIVATIVYLAIGVPQAFALGFLTLVFSVVPAIGTAVVWIPVAAGLALTGRTGAAVVLAVAGVALIGTIDNLVRPYLARRGSLQLPTYIVLVAMFGGLVVIGGWGVLLGPLIVRLAKEALSIMRDERDDAQPGLGTGL